MARSGIAVSIGVLVGVLSAPALGQTATTAPKPAAPPPAVTVPYDAALLRLADIMGSLHFLAQLCDGGTVSPWRDQMTALLDAEHPDDQRRARLVDQFNRGFESYRSVYRQCTDSARLAIAHFEDEGATLVAGLDDKYGRGG